jgi:hypothetical protein
MSEENKLIHDSYDIPSNTSSLSLKQPVKWDIIFNKIANKCILPHKTRAIQSRPQSFECKCGFCGIKINCSEKYVKCPNNKCKIIYCNLCAKQTGKAVPDSFICKCCYIKAGSSIIKQKKYILINE